MKDYVARFWERANKGDPDECWIWGGGPILAKEDADYGHLMVRSKWAGAHRVSWIIHNGPIPAGRHVLHRCDHKQCVNPAHLYLGSQADNNKDFHNQNPDHGKKTRERHDAAPRVMCRLDEFRHKAKLTQVELGELSGVSYRTIQDQEAGVFRSPNLSKARLLTRALSKKLRRKITVDDVWPDEYNE